MQLGKWERALLQRLEREPAFDPIRLLESTTDSQYNAINRAAHSLTRKGLADVGARTAGAGAVRICGCFSVA